MRATLIAGFVATLGFSVLSDLGQEPTKLVSGFIEERSLAPSDKHTYAIFLNEGEAILGQADQHGVDLVIDEFAPDGKLLRTVDSPNGTEGPEPIDLTATATGQYKLVIHTLDLAAKPGKYVMKIERLVAPEENGLRMAQKNFPPPIAALWNEYVRDPQAIDRFLAYRKGKGPIIEESKEASNSADVTYLYQGDENTEKVEVFGGTFSGVGGTRLQRFMHTNLFFGTEIVPKDARYRYGFSVREGAFVGPKKSIPIFDERDVLDELNPESFGGLSVLTLPAAPPQLYVNRNDAVPHGKSVSTSFKSVSMKEDRAIAIYTPPGYDRTVPVDLLIVFDGGTYDGSAGSLIPTPTILDNLIAAKKIGPTLAVFVNNMGHRNRDLGGYLPFANFLALELIPWIRANYRIKDGPSHVVLAGSSRGGLAASHCAFLHPDVVGNVLSQSGAFWVRNDDSNPPPWPITLDAGDLVLSLRNSSRVPVKFYMEVGRFDSLLGINREIRDVLLLKGYSLIYREFNGGHDYLYWRGTFADGLTALIGVDKPN